LPSAGAFSSEVGRTEQWLFTFDATTGEVCRVEKLDPLSGGTQEISEAEYAALDSYLETPAEAPVSAEPPSLSAIQTAAIMGAYWQGFADCAAFFRRYPAG